MKLNSGLTVNPFVTAEEVQKENWPDKLLDWYDIHKRELPWRENKDPYHIWVSEVMSQQTRLEAVIPYYENWMRQFPTPCSLAEADTDEVIKAWQGLGYYSRARNLQLGVREVVEHYGGKVPKTRKEVEALKGIGPYTAGAILSIAYNQREAAIDGNVLRAYARLYDVHKDILGTEGKKEIAALVNNTLPYNRPGDFNEALMDFGATICVPKSPNCEKCPLQEDCLSFQRGTEKELPIRLSKKSTPIVKVTVGLLSYKGYYLLHRRPNTGLLRDMWEFPSLEVMQSISTTSKSKKRILDVQIKGSEAKLELEVFLEKEKINQFLELVQLEEEYITQLTHIFSHRRWEMTAFSGSLESISSELTLSQIKACLPENWCLLKPADFSQLPWAGPHGKLTVYC